MPNFRYSALSPAGAVVTGTLSAADGAAASRGVESLGLIPIETAPQTAAVFGFSRFSRPRPEDVTLFTGDLALLLKTGARIDEALDLLADDPDLGRMRATVAGLAAAIHAGESFSDALARRPEIFAPVYVTLARVGEASNALASVLTTLAAERQRAEAMRRKLSDALRYPAFLLVAATAVLGFFLIYVLPQFAGVFRDFRAETGPVLAGFLAASEALRDHGAAIAAASLAPVLGAVWLSRRPALRARALAGLARLPLVKPPLQAYRAALFCRNLSLLLSSGVSLSVSLRCLADLMGSDPAWGEIGDRVRQGAKFSEALATAQTLPAMAVRTLRLGEETRQLPTLAARVADYYEARLQRGLDRIVGVVGPAAIALISLIVGALIVSVMSALISVNQIVG